MNERIAISPNVVLIIVAFVGERKFSFEYELFILKENLSADFVQSVTSYVCKMQKKLINVAVHDYADVEIYSFCLNLIGWLVFYTSSLHHFFSSTESAYFAYHIKSDKK